MRKLSILVGGLLVLLICFISTLASAQVSGTRPNIAFDPINRHYFMVWEEDSGSGYQIMGKLLNPDGTDAGTPQVISPDRPTQGCFYENFDSDNGPVTTPTNCPDNRNPSVAFNDGKFLIVWEVSGAAATPSSAPDNQYAVVFAHLVNATNLSPLPGWEEGIMVSKIYIAADRPGGCGDSGSYLCNDSQIQAWSQSKSPHVAGRLSGKGFVVTWETNIDFIDCISADRRGGWSIYGRYIDENFSATSKTNPALFAIFHDDSTIDPKCATLDNVDNANHPRIAFNQTSNDFVAVYETARANGGASSIGAKKITIGSNGAGTVSASMMPDVVAAVAGKSLKNPDIISFNGDYILFTDDGQKIYAKTFTSGGIANSTPSLIDLGTNNQTNPRAATNLGQGGQGPTANGAPERILLSYVEGGNILSVLLDNALAVQGVAENLSAGTATQNQSPAASSDQENFLVVWQGKNNGDQVFNKQILSQIPTPGVPSPATNLTATATGFTQIDLTWMDNANNEDGYQIERTTDPACTSASFALLDTVAANTTTYNDTGVTSNTFYCYRVRPFNTNGTSTYSNTANATTPNPTTTNPPTAPALAADPADNAIWAPTRLYLSWQPATDPDAGDSVSYNVYFEIGTTMPTTAVPYKSGITDTHFIIQASTDGRLVYDPDTGITPIFLAANTDYVWKICAEDTQAHETCSAVRQFHTDDSVVGWWRFDEDPTGPVCTGGSTGESLCDYSGFNNNGIPSGGPIWIAAAPDILGRALGFDATNDYVSIANNSSLNPDSVSILALIKTNGKTGEQAIVDKRQGGPSGPAGYELRIQGSVFPLDINWIVTESNGTEHYVTTLSAISDTVRYHLVGTFDINTGDSKTYVNGILSTTQNFGVLNRTNKATVNLILGDTSIFGNPSANNLRGTLDDIIIMNRAQSIEEIDNDYRAAVN